MFRQVIARRSLGVVEGLALKRWSSLPAAHPKLVERKGFTYPFLDQQIDAVMDEIQHRQGWLDEFQRRKGTDKEREAPSLTIPVANIQQGTLQEVKNAFALNQSVLRTVATFQQKKLPISAEIWAECANRLEDTQIRNIQDLFPVLREKWVAQGITTEEVTRLRKSPLEWRIDEYQKALEKEISLGLQANIEMAAEEEVIRGVASNELPFLKSIDSGSVLTGFIQKHSGGGDKLKSELETRVAKREALVKSLRDLQKEHFESDALDEQGVENKLKNFKAQIKGTPAISQRPVTQLNMVKAASSRLQFIKEFDSLSGDQKKAQVERRRAISRRLLADYSSLRAAQAKAASSSSPSKS
jgi:hypothetical protein